MPNVVPSASQHAENPEILVAAANLSIRRGDTTLVRDVTLSVKRGEIVTLIGPNGSGKSTTVKAVLGILKPDAGSVTRATGVKIGYVPQKLEINSTMPIKVRRFMRLTERHSDEAINNALAMQYKGSTLTPSSKFIS